MYILKPEGCIQRMREYTYIRQILIVHVSYNYVIYHFSTSDQRNLLVYISHIILWSISLTTGIYHNNYIPDHKDMYTCGFCCHGEYSRIFVVMVTIQEFKLYFNVTFTHSTVEDIYIPFLSNVMDYIFSLLYIILQMYL